MTGSWPILVVGPGRCGSSTVARLLHTRLGVCMGRKVVGKFAEGDDKNSQGYYEDIEFSVPNRALIDAPQKYREVAKIAIRDPMRWVREWEAMIVKVVAERQRVGRPWGLKDPLISDVLDGYLDLLPDVRIIRCNRLAELAVDSWDRYTGKGRAWATRQVLFREASLDESLARRPRPILSVRFGRERRDDDELVERIGDWLERTGNENASNWTRPQEAVAV